MHGRVTAGSPGETTIGACGLALVFLLAPSRAFAVEASSATVSADARVTDGAPTTVDPNATSDADPDDWSAPPPPRPRKPGVVLETSIGALGFTGKFKHVAPPAPWMHAQLGYEPFSWLMIFGEGEIAYTETTEAVDETRQRAFPIFGFGAGVRATWHVTPRVGLYLQPAIDLLEADVTKNELGILGFEGAEKLMPAFGGRAGVEWYQRDRHLAFAVSGGLRDATGFGPSTGVSDTPLVWDASLAIAYTF